jgi:secondary thiamine-phosphate synthase enzyme
MDKYPSKKANKFNCLHCPYRAHLIRRGDLPAHLKASILGCSLHIPISAGELNVGIWQGIYLCEHRNHGGSRTLVITLQGEG